MHNATIQAVIFDVDGLMFDTEQVGFASWTHAQEVTGYALSEEMVHRTVGRTMDAIEAMFREELSDAPVQAILDASNEKYQQLLEAGAYAIKPGLVELLAYVEGKGLPRILATSARRSNTERKLRAKGMAGRFEHIVTSDDIVHGKPAPDIFLKACEVLGVAPEGALVLEDSNPGVRAAAAAGCPCIMVPDVLDPEVDTRASALAVMQNLHEVLAWLRGPVGRGR